MYNVVRGSKNKFEILGCGMISCQYGMITHDNGVSHNGWYYHISECCKAANRSHTGLCMLHKGSAVALHLRDSVQSMPTIGCFTKSQLMSDIAAAMQGAAIKLYKGLACPLDGFELLLCSLSGPDGMTYPLCPFCYNNPPFEGIQKVRGPLLSPQYRLSHHPMHTAVMFLLLQSWRA